MDDEDFKISLTDNVSTKKNLSKKRKRQQGVMGLIKKNPNITMEEMADVFDVDPRTIHRDIEDLKNVSGIGDKTFEKMKDNICV